MVITIDKALEGVAESAVDTTMYASIPDGVHRLSQESIDALERGRLRGQEIERRHLKRVSE